MNVAQTGVKRLREIVRRVVTQALLLFGVALLLPACGSSNSPAPAPGPATVSTYSDPGIESFPNEGRAHVPVGTAVVYGTDPPTSGNHYPSPQSGGFFDIPIAAGFLVHSMEHGGVIVYYNPQTLTTAQKNTLKAISDAHPGIYGQVVCVPRSDPQYPIILTAWTHRLRLTNYDQSRIDGFLTLFLGQGPESAPDVPWGDPLENNATASPFFTPAAYLRIQDTVRPGSAWTSSGLSYATPSLTLSVDFRASAISLVSDAAMIDILDPTSTQVLARAAYNAATGQLTFSIGSTSFSAVTITAAAYHTVSFSVDAAHRARWSVAGSPVTTAVSFSAPSVSLGLSADFVGGTAVAPDITFGNIVAGHS